MGIAKYANGYYLYLVIMMTIEGVKARMEDLVSQLIFHSRFFSMILADEMATETELLEAIDEMLDEYIELSRQIKKLQS